MFTNKCSHIVRDTFSFILKICVLYYIPNKRSERLFRTNVLCVLYYIRTYIHERMFSNTYFEHIFQIFVLEHTFPNKRFEHTFSNTCFERMFSNKRSRIFVPERMFSNICSIRNLIMFYFF